MENVTLSNVCDVKIRYYVTYLYKRYSFHLCIVEWAPV